MEIFFLILGLEIAAAWPENIYDEPYTYVDPNDHEQYSRGEGSDYEIVNFPNFPTYVREEVPFDLTIFGNKINLKLRLNENLIAPDFTAHVSDEEFGDERLNISATHCHYLHRDQNVVAALSFCRDRQAQGILLMPNDTYEIHPLTRIEPERNIIPHVVRRIPYASRVLADDVSEVLPYTWNSKVKRDEKRSSKKLTIETALFFDEAGYKLFAPYFKGNSEEMADMLLAYMNAIQALYHHPSLHQPIDIVLVKLEILKRQPSDLPHYDGERSHLLDSFCAFNQKHNPKGDQNPKHWDMGLYVSGLDFFAYENGKKVGVTMGLATVGGVCMEKYNCVIAELGTTNVFGKPYPSAGFTSVYVLAHEIGHNIGMHHDSTGNACPKEGYIMSPSRGTNGETSWSTCSADVVRSMPWAKCLEDAPPKPPKNLDHTKYENLPGMIWNAKRQCEVLLKDRDAEIYNPSRLENICENLQCKTPHRSGFYFAGPALEGTSCGSTKWCQGGSCVPKKKKPSSNVVKGGWTEWIPTKQCSSACIQKSKGYQPRRRTCTNPVPKNTYEGCDGPGYEVITCDDTKLCKSKRRSVIDYATMKCQQFSKLLPELDKNASGLQATHESERLWMSCAIFCRRKNSNSFYTPRLDLNDLNVDPYFPDGTWCHREGKINYYCLQHHCLPENFKFTKGIVISNDVSLPQNAPARDHPPSEEILKYLSIDVNKKPLLTTLKPKSAIPKDDDDDWTDNDYIDIPEFRNFAVKNDLN